MPYLGRMPRDTLTREQIVRAAVDLLDSEGLEGLNMRALGSPARLCGHRGLLARGQ